MAEFSVFHLVFFLFGGMLGGGAVTVMIIDVFEISWKNSKAGVELE